MDSSDLLKRFEEDRIKHLWVIYHDYNGRACAKSIPASKFESVVESGVVFARANLDFALNDHMPANGIFQAETGDFLAVPYPDSYRKVPYVADAALVHSWLMTEDYTPFAGCPRAALQKINGKYAANAMQLTAALEAEFALYRKISEGEYEPANTDGMFTVAGLNRYVGLMHQIVDTLEEMGLQVEQLGKEYGPSQYELTLRYGTPLAAADDYLVAKEVVRALALQHNLVATYMPKAYESLPGNGLHVHLGMVGLNSSKNLFSGGSAETPLSSTGLHFVGGLLRHAPGLTGVGAPTVNSYKRLQPGSWAPAHIAWGVGSRAALIRIPDANRRSRVEYRGGDCTCNPYIYLAALLAAGLDGIEAKTDPGPPISDADVGHFSEEQMAEHNICYLPRNLPDALAAFEADEALTKPLSPVIAPEFLKVKRLELDAYNLAVHAWERKMYLEVI